MAIATKKKRSIKPQSRIYEYRENIDPVSIREFVRQELRAEIKKDIAWVRWVLGFTVVAIIGIYGLLWGLKTDIHNLDKRMGRLENKIDILVRRKQ